MNNFEGDPRLFQGIDGSYLLFRDGQPVMDQGFENQVEITILTEPGWVGNNFLEIESRIGSGFISETRKSITITTINNLRQIAEKSLQSSSYGKVEVEIINPRSNSVQANFKISPPGGTTELLSIEGSASNWKGQAQNPANRRQQ